MSPTAAYEQCLHHAMTMAYSQESMQPEKQQSFDGHQVWVSLA